MKVVQLTPWYFPHLGGVELHVKSISDGLRRLGCEVEIFTFSKSREANTKSFRFLRIPSVNECYSIVPLPGLLTELIRSEPDIIHAHSYGYPMAWAAALVKKARGTPFVYTLHSDPYSKIYPFEDAGRLFPVKACDRVIATTKFEEEHLQEMGIDSSKIRIIPQGLDLGRPGPRPTPEPYILCLGRVIFHHKGQDLLVEAYEKGGFREKLVFAGDGPDLIKLRKMTSRNPNIVVLGAIRPPQKWAWLGNSDLVVMPSRFEPYGHVALEALALGRRLVVTRVGGLQHIAAPHAVVADPNPQSLIVAMKKTLTSTSRQTNFIAPSWQEIAEKTLMVYNEMAELTPNMASDSLMHPHRAGPLSASSLPKIGP